MSESSTHPWPGVGSAVHSAQALLTTAPRSASEPPPAAPPGRRSRSAALSLRQKGLLALLAMMALMAWLAALVLAYRASMEQDFDRLDHSRQAGLQSAELAQVQAMALSEIGSQLGGVQGSSLDVEAVERAMGPLDAQYRRVEAGGMAVATDRESIDQARRDWLSQRDRLSLLALHSRLEAGVASLREQTQARESVATAQVARVHERGQAVSAMLGFSAVLGTLLVGAVMVVFFARLSADIGRLRRRAQDVVAGDRRASRTIDRADELGDLGHAIDAMVAALADSEQRLAMEQRHRVHSEKLASIGALAAEVLKEIGNPIAAIDGLARAMRDERDAGALRFDNMLCDPDHILHETSRLRGITRRIAELAAPPSREEMLLSLNELVGNALALARLDPRVAGIPIESSLDPQLPAVLGVGDLLLHLVGDLLAHAADAARTQSGRAPKIRVATTVREGCVHLSVADNGPGMKADHMARALDPMSEPRGHRPGEGRGEAQGLHLCLHIAQRHSGRLRIEPAPGEGTSIVLTLPVPGAAGVLSPGAAHVAMSPAEVAP